MFMRIANTSVKDWRSLNTCKDNLISLRHRHISMLMLYVFYYHMLLFFAYNNVLDLSVT